MKDDSGHKGRSQEGADAFRTARDLLLRHPEDYESVYSTFDWPQLGAFNWSIDWFDVLGSDPTFSGAPALWIVQEDGSEERCTFSELSARSGRVAGWFTEQGVRRGDRVIVMLGNRVELWETLLAAMKIGAVVIPASTLLTPADLADRVRRGDVRHIVADRDCATRFEESKGDLTRIAVGDPVPGWLSYSTASLEGPDFVPGSATAADDPILLYFTSGTTAQPKLVEHTHASYPVGHLSTMYWIGVEPGDVHCNISSPGWAKHAWSSVFAPWNAGACVFVYNYARFDASALLAQLDRVGVTSLCAPPTVWRMLVQSDLSRLRMPPSKVVSAGEPLNPEVIEQVRRSWGVSIRDGFGQTETTAQIGNTRGQPLKPGSMGRPLPGFTVALLDPVTGEAASEGEICLDLSRRPLGLMIGYRDDPAQTAEVMRDGFYHTGDVARRDADGYITYIGRTDDVFKSSDYRVSPFELESVLIEHDAVAEAAVVPSPHPIRFSVPKAYVALAPGAEGNAETARSIFAFTRGRLAPYKRIRRLEFAELPKTISGKIRRVELREREEMRHGPGAPGGGGEAAEYTDPETGIEPERGQSFE